MNIRIGNLNSKIETDNPKLLKALYDLYSFKVPGSEYSHAYRRRHWDGKTHFITKNGTFRTGLLDRLIADLSKIDCVPEIIKEKPLFNMPTTYSIKIKGFEYYDWQKELIETSLRAQRGIIKAPTGAGKTLLSAGIIKALHGRKMVYLFNAKQLLTQTYDFLTKACGIDGVGICFGEGYIYGDIMLCTVQSIEKILDTHLEEAEVLMVDECHEFSQGETTLAALRSFPKAEYRFGFTATVPREPIPLYNLEGALGSVLETVTTKDLVDEGSLTKPIIQMITRPYTASGADDELSYLDVYEEYIVNNDSRNNIIKEIVNDIRRRNKRARILILTKSLNHGRTLEKLCGGRFLEGANSLEDRYNVISEFRGSKTSSVLLGTKILQTGINIEEITHFINARGMKSEIATIQALGRALRKHDSKEEVFVYDFLDNEKYLKGHSVARKRHYKREGHKVEIL